MKKGTLVNAVTIRGTQRDGTFVKCHPSTKGDWYEIKPADKALPNYKTRPGLVSPQ